MYIRRPSALCFRGFLSLQFGSFFQWRAELESAPWTDPVTNKQYWISMPLPHDQKAAVAILGGEGGAAGKDIQFCLLCACESMRRGEGKDWPLLTRALMAQYRARLQELERKLRPDGEGLPVEAFYMPKGVTPKGCSLNAAAQKAELEKRGIPQAGLTNKVKRAKAIRDFVQTYGWADVDIQSLDIAQLSPYLAKRGLALDLRQKPAAMSVLEYMRSLVQARRDDENELMHLRLVQASRHPESYLAGVEALIPCVLHARMRLLEKWLKLLIKQLETADFGQHGGNAAREAQFEDAVEYIRHHVLGHPGKPAKYRMPRTEDGQLKVSMRADKSRKLWAHRAQVMRKLAPPGVNREANLARDIAVWDQLDVILTTLCEPKEEMYTEEELALFDTRCGAFFRAGVDVYGRDAFVSNYMHFIGARHFGKYMRLYGSLQRFSNDGWEALNGKVQWWYMHMTQHGGAQGYRGQREKTARTFFNWRKRCLFEQAGFGRVGSSALAPSWMATQHTKQRLGAASHGAPGLCACAPSPEADARDRELTFVASTSPTDIPAGMVFKRGAQGLGFYADTAPTAARTAEDGMELDDGADNADSQGAGMVGFAC